MDGGNIIERRPENGGLIILNKIGNKAGKTLQDSRVPYSDITLHFSFA